MGAALALVIGDFETQFKITAGFDLFWMSVILLLTLRKALAAAEPHAKSDHRDEVAAAGFLARPDVDAAPREAMERRLRSSSFIQGASLKDGLQIMAQPV